MKSLNSMPGKSWSFELTTSRLLVWSSRLAKKIYSLVTLNGQRQCIDVWYGGQEIFPQTEHASFSLVTVCSELPGA